MERLTLTHHPDFGGHEEVVRVDDPDTGLTAVIAIHSTRRGPALGGTRWKPYASFDDATGDALRLSQAMTHKAAVADLPLGGGKAVIVGTPPTGPARDAIITAYARAIDALGGRYITAEDVGTTQSDMDLARRCTRHVVGVSPSLGGTGDPSPTTARGVAAAMTALARRRHGEASLAGLTVVVSGVGKVGRALVTLLLEGGADVAIADVSDTAIRSTQEQSPRPLRVLAVDEALAAPCDILAPCGLGGVLDHHTARTVSAWAVVGSANNQLTEPSVASTLDAEGVVYVPDYVANAGGLIQVAAEHRGASAAWVDTRVEGIAATVTTLLDDAARLGITPAAAADRLACRRLAAAGGDEDDRRVDAA